MLSTNTSKKSMRGQRGSRNGTNLIRFFVEMRGARTPPPSIDDPVTKIPLTRESEISQVSRWARRGR